ncbi:MAG: calcium/sodium antiporter [Flavobacteriales bacterium]|jgi:cation:H+ antiporter|nr:calcium/sodium antiporter [Flavobacteriales bacterium]
MGILFLVLGLVILVVGGELLVKGAVTIANNFKISPLVIGMTIVSFGTSAPELLVSLQAALDGNPSISIGNVVGSNIANLALVLSITVLIFPIIAERQTKIVDWPMMMLATLLFVVFSLDNQIVWWEGAILFGILVSFTFLLIRNSRKQNKKVEDDELETKGSTFIGIALLLGGLIGLYFGSEWFVSGAVTIAKYFDLSDRVIGVTVVAFGTSAPELVASTVAAYRQQTDISVGNLIGSNLFNIMAVLGITSMVTPISVEQSVLSFDMFWVVGIALAMLPILFIGKKIGRIKGVLLLGSYVSYILIVLGRA